MPHISAATAIDHGPAERSRAATAAIAGLLMILQGPCLATSPPSLQLSPAQSNDGVARLSWALPANSQVVLQRDTSENFASPKLIYRGTDTGSTVTGLSDGTYFFRAAAEHDDGRPGAWSEPVELVVAHHPLTRALGFFAVGAVVFLATLVLVVGGARHHRRRTG